MSNSFNNSRLAAPIALTCGEPAGIGPDLTVMVAQRPTLPPLVAIADPELLSSRARLLGLPLRLKPWHAGLDASQREAGELWLAPLPLKRPARPGQLDPANSDSVLQSLRSAAEGALNGRFAALVTAPVQKSVINDAGHPFSGHTEFFAELAGVERVVMMLACPQLRVALVTTHLPLSAVPAAITATTLDSTLRIVDAELRCKFGIDQPRLLVAGLNPHAGEGGHLGREEIEVITPVLERLRGEGMRLEGPLPADTLFTPPYLARADAVVAMYHDQGLPVLKALGFGEAVNITLGLPFIRTSVDHGTALDLAGSGRARFDSLLAAIDCAQQLISTARS